MAELFIELFSEEIPARMQRNAAEELARSVASALAPLLPADVSTWFGPRRLALAALVSPLVAASSSSERGPRINAPEQALAGFLHKHGASREQVRREGDYWVLEKSSQAVSAAQVIAEALPGLLRRFSWPKSMRWGGSSAFVWVRPLRRIVCLLDGAVVPFDLREGADDGHGLPSGNLTEGHRFHAPGAFAVSGLADWRDKLTACRVLVDAEHRKQVIADRIAGLAAEKGLTVVDDPGLLDEVAGLVEWPVPHLGRIADEHMDLPPEVMQVSMRVNQRYFALRNADGSAAPWFGFVANIQADDDGAAIIGGNERVLRARFADARHFWDLDRQRRLEDYAPKLDRVTFHAKIGSQGERAHRLRTLAESIAVKFAEKMPGADPGELQELASRAAALSKADLVSGMVGEFPELQGVMGRYYALNDKEDPRVADAIRDHYMPRRASEKVPTRPVSIAVALADKLDQLVRFFEIGERPTGSGDPYALRRAALGVIRIIRENELRLRLRDLLALAGADAGISADVFAFVVERLIVQLRAEGARHDVLSAVFHAAADDDLHRLLARTDAVSTLLTSAEGVDLLAAYRRAANILRIEDRKDGPHTGVVDPHLLREAPEISLADALEAMTDVSVLLGREDFAAAMALMARLRGPLDLFFEKVTVNATDPELRRNRLRLLHQVRAVMDRIADFARIEG